MLRVGCYVRVSTEEQAIHGFSIETQIDNLKSHCNASEMKIVDFYADEGISGAKPPMKRPALKRLLDDVQDGKIDLIMFTKLDRWFRSVTEYFKVQEILEKHKVEWKAIHEDYDTTTANGRMAITIFLAIAQNEREKTSERIKVVFEHKRQNKEVCFGGMRLPMGYAKQRDENGIMRLVKDAETEQMTQEFWDCLLKYESIGKAIRMMNEKFGIRKCDKSWRRIVDSEFYCGRYKGVYGFCDPYISPDDWERIRSSRHSLIQDSTSRQTYLFTGLMRCSVCGSVLCGTYNIKTYKGIQTIYRNYRCRYRFTTCQSGSIVSENKIEKFMLQNLRSMIQNEVQKVEVEELHRIQKPSRLAALKEKLRRLNAMFMNENIDDEEYFTKANELKQLIAEAETQIEPPKKDLSALKQFLLTDFQTLYSEMTQEEKRRMWRSLIQEIRLDGKQVSEVVFK